MAKRLLFDPELKRFAPNLGVVWSVDIKSQKPIRNLDEFASDIGNFNELDELVLFFHGFPGGIRLGRKGFALSDADLRKAFKKKTKIRSIRFEGCWVGERPDEMEQFGHIFDASQLSGFTWEGVRALATVPILKGESADAIANRLKPYQTWFADRTPSAAELANQAKTGAITKELLLEWWQLAVIVMAPPYETQKGETKTNFEKFGSHTYKRRDDAADKTIKATEIEDTGLEPISSFEYVTVTR
jgi:hypothetical protein